VPLALFRSRTFAGVNLATLLLYAALGGCLFFVPFDLIQVQRYSPAAAGAALLPFVVLVSALSPWAGGLVARYGPRPPLVVGPLVTAAGFVLLGLPSVGGPYVTTFFPGITVLGLGMGVTVAPLTTTVMGAVEQRHAGVASGINNAVARTAGLLAVAALGVLLVTCYARALDRELDGLALPPSVRAFVEAGRSKLAAADIPPEVDPATRTAIGAALERAFLAGFRMLMFAGAALAAMAAGVSLVLVGRRFPTREGAANRGERQMSRTMKTHGDQEAQEEGHEEGEGGSEEGPLGRPPEESRSAPPEKGGRS
jgi:MFS family permease